MPRPMAASAAATTIMKTVKIWPASAFGLLVCSRYRENAMKFRFAAFRINSIDMKITMMLRRVSTPATPMMKRIAAMTRNFERSGCWTLSQTVCSREPSFSTSINAGIRVLSIWIRNGLSFLVHKGRQLGFPLDLVLQYFGCEVVGRRLLFDRSRQHYGADDCHQQQHACDFKRK